MTRLDTMPPILVRDLDGQTTLDCEADLIRRLTSIRTGQYGAFILSHDTGEASLWLHINGDMAYLHYFPGNNHPGFQPAGSSPVASSLVRFLMVGGSDADAIEMPGDTLVPVDVAYLAAIEFLKSPVLPKSVSWSEL